MTYPYYAHSSCRLLFYWIVLGIGTGFIFPDPQFEHFGEAANLDVSKFGSAPDISAHLHFELRH